MEVEATIDSSLIFTGEQLNVTVEFIPPTSELGLAPPVLLSGYAVVQGSFRLGDIILSEPFADTRKAGVILGRRGIEYGAPANAGGLFAGVLDGLRHLVVNNAASSGSGRGSNAANSSDDEESEYPIFSTSQVLLFTHLELTERQKFRLAVDLPPNLPPTYRSRSLHISYHFIVGFERLNPGSQPIDSRMFLPFRLLPKTPTIDDPIPAKFDLRVPVNAPPPRSIDEEKSDLDAVDVMNDYINGLLDVDMVKNRRSSSIAAIPGAKYTKVSFDISRSKTLIATMLLARPAIRVGDVLAAQIKLHRPCLHLSAFFELEEMIQESYSAIPGNQSKTGDMPEVSSTYTTYARQYQGVYGLKEVSIYLPTLTSITPRLDTEQITASWSLRLEFVGLAGSALADTGEEDGDGLLAKGQVDYELFSCRIPIAILPPENGGQNASKTWKLL